MVSGGYCEVPFPDTVCWTRLGNTWLNFWPVRIHEKPLLFAMFPKHFFANLRVHGISGQCSEVLDCLIQRGSQVHADVDRALVCTMVDQTFWRKLLSLLCSSGKSNLTNSGRNQNCICRPWIVAPELLWMYSRLKHYHRCQGQMERSWGEEIQQQNPPEQGARAHFCTHACACFCDRV